MSEIHSFVMCAFVREAKDGNFSLSEARAAYYRDPSIAGCELKLSESDFGKSAVSAAINVINEVNFSMIGPYEDDAIYSADEKVRCLEKLKAVEKDFARNAGFAGIISLFEYAVDHGKNIYFFF
jgi:hypothetical protein